MIDSDWVLSGSVVVGEQGPLVGDPELPVAPDAGGQGQQPLADADEHPTQGATTMLFQPQLVLEGVDHALDPLAHAAKRSEPARLILAIRPDEAGAQRCQMLFQGPTSKALVGQDDRAGGQRLLAGGVVQQHRRDLAFAQLGGGQAPADRHAVWSGEQVQLEAPVPAAVAAVIAVGGVRPQRRTLDRLAGLAAWQRGGVQQPEAVAPRRGGHGQVAHGQAELVRGGAQALVVAGLAGQVREQVAEAVAGESQPVAFRAGAQQDLGNRQADELGVAELGPAARTEPWAQQLVDGDVQCDDEVVETGVHGASPEVDVAMATPTLGGLVSVVSTRRPHTNSASVI